jgi:hypothetical protein
MRLSLPRTRDLLVGFMLALIGIAPVAAQNDLSVTTLVEPASGCALTSTENVSIRLFNFGTNLPAGTGFNVSYAIDAGMPVTELIVLGSTLLSNSVLDYTFTTPADLSVPGTYSFSATVNLPGDVNPTNDASAGNPIVNASPTPGTLSAPPSGSSGTLTLTGTSDAIVQWEESPDALRWFKLANTTTTQSYTGITTTTHFRVRLVSGSCPSVVTNEVVVDPSL